MFYLSRQAPLVSGANINPSGTCPPQVGFDRKRSIARKTWDRIERA
jgi:hypothetical protein